MRMLGSVGVGSWVMTAGYPQVAELPVSCLLAPGCNAGGTQQSHDVAQHVGAGAHSVGRMLEG